MTDPTKITPHKQRCLFDNKLKSGKIVFFSWDPKNDWQVLSVSDNIESVFGYKPDDFKSGRIVYASLIHPNDIEHVSAEVEEACRLKEEEFTHSIYRIKDAHGIFRYVYDHTKIVRNEDNEIIEFHGYISDETDIIEKKNRYELILSSAKMGMWDWHPQTNDVFFDKNWTEMIGYEHHEIEQNIEAWESRVHPDDLDNTYKDIQAHINGETERYENVHRMKHKNGSWRYILDRGKIAECDKAGNVLRFTDTHMDITPLKETQAQLEIKSKHLVEISKRYKTLLQLSSEAVFILNVNGKLLEYSDLAKKYLGYNDEEMQNLRVTDWDKGLTIDQFHDIIKNTVADETINFEQIHTRKDGSTYTASIQARVIEIDGLKTVHSKQSQNF